MKAGTNKDGSSFVVLQTPVVDDKGQVVGTEARTFTFLKQGRNLEVAEEGLQLLAQDTDEVRRFIKSCSHSPVDAAGMLVQKTAASMSRFRSAYQQQKTGVHLIDFVKKSFAGQHAALGNVVCALLYATPEYCADEVHLATMGLSDNHSALSDIVAASSHELLGQIGLFYGIKFGDGRYEVKSADGRGDADKLLKDARFALRGNLQQLLTARIELSTTGQGAPIAKGSADAAWDAGLCDFLASAGPAQLKELRDKHNDLAALSNTLAEGDAALARAIFGIVAAPTEYWSVRLREAVGVGGAQLNKKLLLRVVAMLNPDERRQAALRVPELLAKLAPDEEGKLLRALFQ